MSALDSLRRMRSRLGMYVPLCPDWRAVPGAVLFAGARGHPFSASDPLARLLYRMFPVLRLSTIRTGDLRLVIDPGDTSQMAIFDELILHNTWDLSLVPFLPETVIDAGAHAGFFSLMCRAAWPQAAITAIEPDPGNLKMIRRQIAANGLKLDLLEGAASNYDGQANFHRRASFSGSLEGEADDGTESTPTEVFDLLRIIRGTGGKPLLLKLDIEGEEEKLFPEILPVLPAETFIFLETHRGEESWQTIASQLEAAGFEVVITRRHYLMTEGHAVRGGRRADDRGQCFSRPVIR